MIFFKKNKIEPPKDDISLIQQYKSSLDLTVLSTLYQPYMHLVYGLCLKYLRSEASSKDAVMDIFEKLAQDLIKHEVKHFKSWLYIYSKNHCLMELRKRKRDPIAAMKENKSNEDVENAISIHPSIEEEERLNPEKLVEEIKKLPKEQKQCIELFYFENKCYQEISTITSYDFKQVKSYIQNGRRNLKNSMLQDG